MSVRTNYVSVKLTPNAHSALRQEAERRYGDADAITWSALVQDLVEEAQSDSQEVLPDFAE